MQYSVYYIVYYNRNKKNAKESVYKPVIFNTDKNLTFEKIVSIFENLANGENQLSTSEDVRFFLLKRIFKLRTVIYRTDNFNKKDFDNAKDRINKKANKELNISQWVNRMEAGNMMRFNIICTDKLNDALYKYLSQNANRNLTRVEGIINIAIIGKPNVGKSSLINEILYKQLANDLNGAKKQPGLHREITGLEYVDKVIDIDQSPIGRTPRSNPATYTGVFDQIRDLFAATQDAKAKGYKKGRFSFNVKGGRCEACSGDGIIKIEMNFLPDVYVPCEVCDGKRYNRETLDVRYKGKNIYEVLDMTVEEALAFFENIPSIRRKIETLNDVGLSYIKLGQPSTTLSGGEAQRIKLATELSRRSTGKTIYILDEPTTGLHFADVHKLVEILHRLKEGGNTVVVIEHNLDVIKTADYIIDVGPEGGDKGGTVIAKGTPEEVMKNKKSYTGEYLKKHIDR